MKLRLQLILTVMLCSLANLLNAQLSPSGQSEIIVPQTLSGCSVDTVEVRLTNLTGPSCPATSGAGALATYSITLPGATSVSFVSGSLTSIPLASATFVSFVGNVLTFTAPPGGLGSSTIVRFLVQSTCDVSSVFPLPYFDVSVVYPSGFTPASESWQSVKSNTGVGLLKVNIADWFGGGVNPTRAFREGTGNYVDIVNTGFGDITEVEYNLEIDDSMYLFYGPANVILMYNYTKGYASVDPNGVWSESQTGVTFTQTVVNGKRFFNYKYKGLALGPDRKLKPGEILRLAYYLRVGFTCMRDQINKLWVNPICAGGGAFCSPGSDTFVSTVKIGAGTPIISANNRQVDTWDGCPNKFAAWTFVNTGIPSATRPEVSTAHDLNLSLNLKGSLVLSNVILANNGTPINISSFLPVPGSAVNAINFNFNNKFTTDPDGAGGLQDIDGDGYFDELRPGDSLRLTFNWEVPCDLVCGPSLHYQMSAGGTFTDFCRNLNGSSSNLIYEFGFEQVQAVSQYNNFGVFPNYGTLANGAIEVRPFTWGFKYKKHNVYTGASTVKLRLNYGKSFQVVGPVKFLSFSIPLSSFTKIGTGDTLGTAAGAANNTTDNDSALEFTLTPVMMDSLWSSKRKVADSVGFNLAIIACDSFQNQNNRNGFQLLFKLNNSLCGASPKCEFDLACNPSPIYNVSIGCGSKPCYLSRTIMYRESAIGWTDETETTPIGTISTKGYEGDTFTQITRYYLNADWPVMEPVGTFGPINIAGNGFREYQSNSFHKPVGSIVSNPLLFLDNVSRVRIIDTVTNTVLFDVPLTFKHFLKQNTGLGQTAQSEQPFAPFLNGNTNTTTINGYNNSCGATWYTQHAGCPIFNTLYRGSPYYYWFENQATDKAVEMYYLNIENALFEAGVSLDIGYAKYHIEVVKKWRANEAFPWNNVGDFNFVTGLTRYGNNNVYAPLGTSMGLCGPEVQSAGTVVTKSVEIPDQGRTYGNCGSTINNKFFFRSVTGNYLGAGEVRVPYKLDSIVATLPSEYTITAGTISFNGTTSAATASATTGNVKFTNNTAVTLTTYPDFPRMTDASGLTLTGDLQYTISQTANNSMVDLYKVPVRYYVRDEFNKPTLLIDTIFIDEGTADLTISPITSTLNVDDGGTCQNYFIDYLVANNTLYTAANTYLAARSSATSTPTTIKDVNTENDPIVTSDITTWGTTNKQAYLGTLAPAEQRIVRVFYAGSACTDILKVYADFGCSVTTPGPNFLSTTLDSTTANMVANLPAIITAPVVGRINVANLCDTFVVEVELQNSKNSNVFNLKGGFKLPSNMTFVAGSFRTKTLPLSKAAPLAPLPEYKNIVPANLTLVGADSASLNITADPTFSTNGYCGLPRADSQAFNKVFVKFTVEFNACAAGTSNFVNYNFDGESFCGAKTSTGAVVNFVYVGTGGTPSNYTCKAQKNTQIAVCAGKGETIKISDDLYIKNIGTGASSSLDTMEITVGIDTSRLTLSNFTVSAPFTTVIASTNLQGRPVLKIPIPAGLAINDSFKLPLKYDLTPKIDNVCTNANVLCSDIGHSVSFYSVPILNCVAKGITGCVGLGKLTKGNAFVPRDIVCCAALGNFVWIDDNKDGIQDPNELGVAGVTVTLYDTFGKAVASTVTDAYGKYLFDKLVPGDYSVGFEAPTNYTITTAGNGTTANGSDANASTGRTAKVSLAPSEINLNVDCGLIQDEGPGQNVGDKVWFDTNKDGIQDAGESGIAGVTVTLYDNTGKAIATTVTNADGEYNFTNVPVGNYTVGFTPPIGLVGTGQTSNTANGSDMDPATFKTASFAVVAGQDRTDIDAGFYPQLPAKASLGNLVWNDLDNDGTQDPEELGVEGVTVTLYDNGGTPIATTKTDAFGNYVFNNLDAGTYSVGFTTLPSGFAFSPINTGGAAADSLDSDVNTGTGRTGSYTLAAGDANMSVDAGIHKPGANFTLGNFVWLDSDKDGIQDAAEAGIAGVMVVLRDAAGIPIDTTYTDKDGQYLFTNLPAGAYSVKVANYPGGLGISPKDATSDLLDSDADATGATPTVTLSGANPNDRSLDIGLQPAAGNSYSATLGNKVFFDGDNDGRQDADEPGISGTKVYLYSADGTTILDSTTTDAKGEYLFTGLPAGEYFVGVKLPPSYIVSPKGASATDSLDANGNPAVSGITKSDKVSLSSGEDNLTIDFGISKPTALIVGDRVWLDADKNGIQDLGEEGVSGIGVRLLDSLGNTIMTAVTDANGNYLFVDVPEGKYKIQFTNLPTGYVFTAKDTTGGGATNFTDSDVDKNTGKTDAFTVDNTYTWTTSGTTPQRSYDAGIYPNTVAAVKGTYWNDVNGDGIQDPTEIGLVGMRVTLYDNAGNPVASTITDANGNYNFPNVIPGIYSVGFEEPPSGTEMTQQNTPGTIAGTSNSDANPTTRRTAPFVLAAGQIQPDVDAGVRTQPVGSIGDKIWFDNDYDGVQDASEAGVPGVIMELLDNAGNVIATTVTDGNGNYLFSNLPPGDYKVRMASVPEGYQITRSDAGGDDTKDNDFNKSTKTTGTISLGSGQNVRNVDGGISPISYSTIGNFVWEDNNIDGVPSPGEPAAAGVKVILWDSLTGTAIDSITTTSTGYFLFDSLPPGSYKLSFSKPAWKNTYKNSTNNLKDSFDSDADEITGFTINYRLGVNDTNLHVWAGFIPAATPLNSKFLRFNATLTKSLVNYGWTFQENALVIGYEVKRKFTNKGDWKTISNRNAIGTNNTITLNGLDNLSAEAFGVYYYQVNALYNNGTSLPSSIAVVNYAQSNKGITISPNPTSSKFNINLDTRFEGTTSIEIYTVEGKLIYTNNLSEKLVEISTIKWSEGIYNVRIVNNGTAYNEKVVIVK